MHAPIFWTLIVDGTPRCKGVAGTDVVALMNSLALDEGVEEITAVREGSTRRCATPLEPREVR